MAHSPAVSRLVDVLRHQLGTRDGVPLHAPIFTGRERDYVLDCLDTGWVSSVGSYVDRFEEMTAAVAGTRFAMPPSTAPPPCMWRCTPWGSAPATWCCARP